MTRPPPLIPVRSSENYDLLDRLADEVRRAVPPRRAAEPEGVTPTVIPSWPRTSSRCSRRSWTWNKPTKCGAVGRGRRSVRAPTRPRSGPGACARASLAGGRLPGTAPRDRPRRDGGGVRGRAGSRSAAGFNAAQDPAAPRRPRPQDARAVPPRGARRSTAPPYQHRAGVRGRPRRRDLLLRHAVHSGSGSRPRLRRAPPASRPGEGEARDGGAIPAWGHRHASRPGHGWPGRPLALDRPVRGRNPVGARG